MNIFEFQESLLLSGLSQKTSMRYSSIVEKAINRHGTVTLEIAKKEIINQLKTNSPASANKYILAFKAFSKHFKLGFEEELRKIKETPTPKRQPSVAIAKQIVGIENFKKRCSDLEHLRYSIIFELLFLTGMRLNEVIKLKKSDVSRDEIIIRKSKTGSGRRIATPPATKFQNKLFTYLDSFESEWAFPSNKSSSRKISDRSCRYEFSERLKELGIEYNYTPHTFRGSFMTRNLRNKAVLYDVQDIVGHKSSETTRIYYRGDLETQRDLMKQDPASTADLTPEEQFKHLVDSVRMAGIFDKKCFTYKLTEHSLHIEIKSSK